VTGLEDRLARDLSRLAARVDPRPPPPLELLERRAEGADRAGPGAAPRAAPRAVAATVAAAVIAVAAAGIVLLVPRPGGDSVLRTVSGPASPASLRPAVPAPAPFALSSRGEVVTAGGAALSADAPMSAPRWSSDGQWVAFQVQPAGDIHIVAGDGSSDRVAWRGDISAFVWSAAGPARLAVAPRGGGVVVVDPGGRTRWALPRGVPVISMGWRGADLSWAPARPGGGIGLLRADGARTTITGAAPAVLVFAGWVGSDHLLVWVGGGGLDEGQGLRLEDLRIGGGRVVGTKVLATTLVATGWVVPGPAATPAAGEVLVVGGAGAIPWAGKTVERCELAGDTCQPLVPPDGASVTLDPVWSPDGGNVAFVEATAWPPGRPGTVADWFPTRRLWVARADGSDAHPVAGAGSGVTAPSWTADGSWLRYSTGDAVMAVPAAGGASVLLAGDLAGGGAGAGPDGYGKGPWTGLVAWSPAA
jgi:hypothetical protein